MTTYNPRWSRRRMCRILFAVALMWLMSISVGAAIDDITFSSQANGVTVDHSADFSTIEISCNGLTGTNQYAIMMVEGTTTNYQISAQSILYIDQKPATNGTITFDIKPTAANMKDSVILLSGQGMDAPIVAASVDVTSTGVDITGQVTSYHPAVATEIELYDVATENKVASTSVTGEDVSGQQTQIFTLNGVPAGTYNLVVKKAYNLTYTIRNVKVDSQNIDLRERTDKVYSNIILIAGDVNNNGAVNVNDLNTVWSSANYNKDTVNISEKQTDINNNGSVNVNDLNIVWSSANYNKDTSHCSPEY